MVRPSTSFKVQTHSLLIAVGDPGVSGTQNAERKSLRCLHGKQKYSDER